DLYPLEGYRRLAYLMLDADIVAVSPSSVYRVLKVAGKLAPRGGKPSQKGQGFEQPLRPHEHWHIDVSYLNVRVPGPGLHERSRLLTMRRGYAAAHPERLGRVNQTVVE